VANSSMPILTAVPNNLFATWTCPTQRRTRSTSVFASWIPATRPFHCGKQPRRKRLLRWS
jgi:hypothetical protein